MTTTVEEPSTSDAPVAAKPSAPTRHQILNKLYALPVPLRTYPLPTFVPHNPLSLFHVLYTWISQALFPPLSHPEPLYEGWFSPETRSIHIADHETVRALWEQGFFGKGTLSRSEPSWMEREKRRKGAAAIETAEDYTKMRRAERQQTKWERARKEREAIDQKLEEERRAAELKNSVTLQDQETLVPDVPAVSLCEPIGTAPAVNGFAVKPVEEPIIRDPEQPGLYRKASPVGPLQLLRLPNSNVELLARDGTDDNVNEDNGNLAYEKDLENTIVELESLMDEAMKGTDDTEAQLQQLEDLVSGIMSDLPAGLANASMKDQKDTIHHAIQAITEEESQASEEVSDDSESSNNEPDLGNVRDLVTNGSAHVLGSEETNGELTKPNLPRSPKSVRFSPTVEEATFLKTSPPSPDAASPKSEPDVAIITNQEHLQLTMEEALFLSYGLGVLKVLDPATKQPISNTDLFRLCRMSSHFPPQPTFVPSPDDPFMLSYVVYHHFRSLGWVVRGGIKFSVDFMLYNRGPVFSHAEFAILILPSYSHAYWSENEERKKYVQGKEKRDWHWLHCINRVNTQVKKTLVLVYVDIPPPVSEEAEKEMGVSGALARYGLREVVLKRWLYNRQRA